MATEIIPHVEEIRHAIDTGKDFVVNGGAGSGKTFTLIETLKYVFDIKPNVSIACITYTNVAVNEIKNRFPYDNLWVSTIHEFVWKLIKNYTSDIIFAIVELKSNGSIRYSGELDISHEKYRPNRIIYGEYQNLDEGIISHNAVLEIGLYLFENHLLLSKILSDSYEFIFIDEYQDTDKKIVKLLLEEFRTNTSASLLGFFGDPMQSIYGTGIGDVRKYVDEAKQLKEILITGNRRCSEQVIKVLNNLRSDIHQEPANNNHTGSVKFLYSSSELSIEALKAKPYFKEWDFNNTEETRELYLTHRLIASKQHFNRLLEIYREEYGNSRAVEKLMGDSRDALSTQLHRLEELVYLYRMDNHNEFIRKTEYKLSYHKDKIDLYTKLKEFDNTDKKTIDEILTFAEKNHIISTDDNLLKFQETHGSLFSKVMKLPYLEVKNMYSYANDFSPYSTQHGIKGAEFNDVFVVLDNGGWNNYNFEQLLGIQNRESVYNRTLKIMYVCCSRAKRNLIVYCPNFKSSMLSKAENWFGKDSVIEVIE